MSIYQLDHTKPTLHTSCWVADDAIVIGDVVLNANCSVWFHAVLRGDTAQLSIGQGTNIQDNSVLHADKGFPLTIGEYVTIGHNAVVHGCTIGNNTLIGIGAIILNGAKIGNNCLVAAGAFVPENKTYEDGSLILGSPAKPVRTLSAEQIANLRQSAEHYIENAQHYQAHLKRMA